MGGYRILEYRIIDDGKKCLTKHLTINPGQNLSYHKHAHKSETIVFIEGNGILIIDSEAIDIMSGEMFLIKPGMKHAIKANTELHIIEVQVGDELTEEDIEFFKWDW